MNFAQCVTFILAVNQTYFFVSCVCVGSIEERIFQRQVSKQGLSGTVVDLGKGAEHTSFSTSELRDLFTLTDTPCITHDLLACSCSMDGSVPGQPPKRRINTPTTAAVFFGWPKPSVTRSLTPSPPRSLLSAASQVEEEQLSDRRCQLGRQGDRGGASQKPLSMSELMQWRHFSGDTATFSDPYLDHARNHITFAFQTTVSHTHQ